MKLRDGPLSLHHLAQDQQTGLVGHRLQKAFRVDDPEVIFF